MSTSARRRLMRDLKRIRAESSSTMRASPSPDNILVWNATLLGPEDTMWEGAILHLVLEFTEEYPAKPPKVHFATTVFHPNVYKDGNICLDILQKQWAQIYDVAAILTSIQSLLSDPNPNSPANANAADLFQRDPRRYYESVRECVELSWFQ
mmetsp:Transcript_23113/g.57852  ORF Transcript_23113/g.57852 Transcript_23113/m.57852 type:complete len:152 (-) Transcript_23113:44-499(-)|eukprot:CAMPEP_0174241718 /NCGR_PEP_ID=MMETSP0417-20130205/24529_1 /TAXON_ID=242541 /ORGANISM="Mayorella sp, Strain BSH-02190019" /LENGTH=151 /DNA_ID=CAMNT_0015321001 /DNA_START=66 /DNA_END=521 /DNA_ORIENTATION=-